MNAARRAAGTVILTNETRERMRARAAEVGVREAARSLGVSAPTFTTGAAGLPIRAGSAALIERGTEHRDAA